MTRGHVAFCDLALEVTSAVFSWVRQLESLPASIVKEHVRWDIYVCGHL